MKKGMKGITLIALVITIIVLLILSGITITTLTGDNGLLQKTEKAKNETLKVEGKEKIEVEVLGSYNRAGNIEIDTLNKNLGNIKELKILNDNNEIEDLPVKLELNGYEYLIKSDGTVIIGGVDAEYIKNNAEKYYGSYITNYDCPNNQSIINTNDQLGKWQIFLADENSIYLIPSNHIDIEYGINFSSILEKYPASKDNTVIPELLSKFDNYTRETYHKWMNIPDNQIKGYSGEKSVAIMIDIDLWKGYNNSTYCKYAIGGPTIEMFCESYNKTHTDRITPKLYPLGYKIQKNEDEESLDNANVSGLATNPTIDDMYFNKKGKYYYYLASSSGDTGHKYILNVGYSANGNIRANSNYTIYFKPIVCLKSNVHLIENTDDENNITYSLELD